MLVPPGQHIVAGSAYSGVAVAKQPRASLLEQQRLSAISIEYTYPELARATSNFHSSRKLGSGSYGAVYKGEMEDGSEVAIKAIDLGALGAQGQTAEMAGFEDEVQMLSKFRHPNLVTLIGWGKNNLQRYLVYELLAGGDSFQRLQKCKNPRNNKPFYWYERLSIILDAATGLSHMHNSKPKAFHRDIKSANILIDRHGTAKMADFGLSCSSGQGGALHVTVRTISGTPGYACPLYSRTGRVTEGSEIYSFGMVMLELLTGLAPAAADPNRPGAILYHIADHIAPSKPGALDRCIQRLEAPAQWPAALATELATLGLRCVHATDESIRPRFVELVRSVRNMTNRFPKPEPQNLVAMVQPACAEFVQAGVVAGNSAGPPAVAEAQQERKGQMAKVVQAVSEAVAPSSGGGGATAIAASPAPPSVGGPPAPYFLEIVHATGVNRQSLAPELRRLSLYSTESSGSMYVAHVGRQHQQALFEAWLPSESLRSCVSRTAFDICWSTGPDFAVNLLARGGNPVQADGVLATKDVPLPLRTGSDITFTYNSAGDTTVFLQLRLVAQQFVPRSAVRPPVVIAAQGGNSAQTAGAAQCPPSPELVVKTVSQKKSPRPATTAVEDAQREIRPSPLTRPASEFTPADRAEPVGRKSQVEEMIFECTLAEGTSTSDLAAVPMEIRVIRVKSESPTLIGRQHQPNLFETLAPSRLNLISRTHVHLEFRVGALMARNMSFNPLYVEGDLVPQGEAKPIQAGQILSFARMEDGSHIHFLQFKARTSNTPAVPPAFERVPDREGAKVRWGPEEERQLRGRQLDDDSQPPPICRNTSFASTKAVSERAPSSHAPSSENSPEKPRLAEVASPQKHRGGADSAWPTSLPDCLMPPSPGRPPAWSPSPGDTCTPKRPPNSGTSSLMGPSSTTSSPSKRRSKEELPPRPAASPLTPSKVQVTTAPSSPEQTPEDVETGQIILELTGSSVLDVAREVRTIGPISVASRPLFVGRKHQMELHKNAVAKESLQFLSRDHFRISVEDGAYKMLVLTANPVWRDRNGESSKELTAGDVVTLMPGDRIALGTGDQTSTFEEACRSLCWVFQRAPRKAQAKLAPEWSNAWPGDDVNSRCSPGSSPQRPRSKPRSPGGLGLRPSDLLWGGSSQPSPRGGSNFEPMLPPAAEMLGHSP